MQGALLCKPDVMLELHKYVVVISRIEVKHFGYGVAATDSMRWDTGSILKPRFSSLRVVIDHASLPGSPEPRDSFWCGLCLSPSLRRM